MDTRSYKFIILLLCFAVSAGAQHRYDLLFHKNYATRAMIFDTVVLRELFKLEPAAFYREIDALQERARKEHDHGVELEAIMGRYVYMEDRKLSDVDEKIATMEQLLRDLDRERYPEYAVLIMFDLGNNYYGRKHNYSLAFEHYINAYNLAKKFSSKDFPAKKNVLVGVGNRYYSIGDPEKARDILLEADTLPPSWITLTNYNNQNTLGLIYRSYQEYDTAISYFKKTLTLAEKDGDTVWAAIATGNIGISYYLQGNYTAAIPLLKKDIATCLKYKTKATDNAVNSLLILADIHLKMDSIKEVAHDIQTVSTHIDSCRDRMKPLSMLYPVLARYYYKKGDLHKAYIYQDSAAVYKDSLAQRDNIYKLAKVEHKKELEKHEAELQRLSAEKKLVEFTRNALIAVVLLVCIITGLIINRQRLKHRIKQHFLLAKKELAEQELQNAARQLENYTRRLQEKNALIETSGHEIEKLQILLANTQAAQVNNDVLQQIYAATILTDDEWTEFKLLFEQVHTGYLQRLKDKMPDLTPADTKFMVLSRLKLSNKEMAGILGVQPDTIRSYKHRLRKRFDLPEDAAIKEFVDAI